MGLPTARCGHGRTVAPATVSLLAEMPASCACVPLGQTLQVPSLIASPSCSCAMPRSLPSLHRLTHGIASSSAESGCPKPRHAACGMRHAPAPACGGCIAPACRGDAAQPPAWLCSMRAQPCCTRPHAPNPNPNPYPNPNPNPSPDPNPNPNPTTQGGAPGQVRHARGAAGRG